MLINTIADFGPIITAVGIFVTAIGVFVAAKALRENHEWNRRQHASNLLAMWNEKSKEHRKIIEKWKPGLLDLVKGHEKEITTEDVRSLYIAEPGTANWDVRFSVIELLNLIEFVSISYKYHVVDKEMIDMTIKPLLRKYHEVLHVFVHHVYEQRGYNPWQPYYDVLNSWEDKPQKPKPPMPTG